MALEQTMVINGTFGKLYHDGEHLTNVNNVEIEIEVNMEEVHRSGTRRTGHKPMNIIMSGTIGAYFVSYDFIEKISQIKDDDKGSFVTDMIFRYEDPQNPGASRSVLIEGIQFENFSLANAEVDTVAEHELQFVFDDFTILPE